MSQRKFFQLLFLIGQEATQDMVVWAGVGGWGSTGVVSSPFDFLGGGFDEVRSRYVVQGHG